MIRGNKIQLKQARTAPLTGACPPARPQNKQNRSTLDGGLATPVIDFSCPLFLKQNLEKNTF